MRLATVPWCLEDVALSGRLLYSFAVDSDNLDPIEQDLVAGTWEPSPAIAWLLSVIKRGDRVLDLGAHIGTFALPAAALGAQVTAVEASPRNATLLRSARETNGFDNLSIIELAVDASPGTLTFLDAGPVSTIETASVGTASGDFTFRVEATTVDCLNTSGFDWAKVDIEGSEERALAGAVHTLRQLKGLVIESNGHALNEQGSSPGALAARLRDAGLLIYGADGHRLFPMPRRFFQPETNIDYVAVPGRLPLPNGWTLGPKRTTRELSAALGTELRHPVPEHSKYARHIRAEAPIAIKLRLMLMSLSTPRGPI